MFHGNFWANVEMDLKTGRFVEKESLLADQSELHRMADPEFMVEQLKDDLALQLYAFKRGLIRELNRERISRLAAHLGYPMDWSERIRHPATGRRTLGQILSSSNAVHPG